MPPLADARVGEWCRYRTHDGMTQRIEVVARDPARVTVEVRMTMGDRPLGLPARRYERPDIDHVRRHAEGVGAAVTTDTASVEVAGRMWRCRLIEQRWTAEDVSYVRKTWRCPEVPVYGIVRLVQTANTELQTRMELVAYGAAVP
jgi:hypothetical protein